MTNCLYPESEWAAAHLRTASRKPGFLPEDWKARVRLDLPPERAECELVVDLKELRQGERLQEIRNEAEHGLRGTLRNVLAVLGPITQKFLTQDMLVAAAGDIEIATMVLKLHYQQGRPRHCCDETRIEPMYRGTRHDPLHASYPSGHSTQAHAAALLLAECSGSNAAQRREMLDAAARIAQNREVAGLHYPSDSAAGKSLAEQLVPLLLASASFRAKYFDPASKEWP